MNHSSRCCRAVVLITLASSIACSGGGYGSPSTPTPPATTSLSGTVTAVGGGALAGASVTILDGANAGRATTTDGNGLYRFDAVTAGNANVSAKAAGYHEQRLGLVVTGAAVLNFTLALIVP